MHAYVSTLDKRHPPTRPHTQTFSAPSTYFPAFHSQKEKAAQRVYVHRIPSLHNTQTSNSIHKQIHPAAPLFLRHCSKHGKRLL